MLIFVLRDFTNSGIPIIDLKYHLELSIHLKNLSLSHFCSIIEHMSPYSLIWNNNLSHLAKNNLNRWLFTKPCWFYGYLRIFFIFNILVIREKPSIISCETCFAFLFSIFLAEGSYSVKFHKCIMKWRFHKEFLRCEESKENINKRKEFF
jgi:hypothetical protein